MRRDDTSTYISSKANKAYPLLVKRDLFGETLLGEVAHSIVVSIRQEMRQLVLVLGVLLQEEEE